MAQIKSIPFHHHHRRSVTLHQVLALSLNIIMSLAGNYGPKVSSLFLNQTFGLMLLEMTPYNFTY